MPFLIKDDELLNIINFGKRVKNFLDKKFDSDSVYNKKYLQLK